MAVTFNEIPSTNRVPAAYVEIDGSRALAVQPGELHRTLLVGLMSAGGTAAANTVVAVQGELSGDPLFGVASQLAAMCRAYKRVDGRSRLYALPIAENAAGTAAAGSFALAGTATYAGTLTTRIGDVRISTAVPVGMTAADLATAHAASVNAVARLPLTAAVVTATINVTARHKGESGNAITLETESLPAGITCTDTQPTGGATNPVLTSAIAAIDEARYDTIITGLTDATGVLALEAEVARRWGPLVKRPGHLIGALRGTHGTVLAYGNARNSQHSTIIGYNGPTPPWVVAAQAGARDAQQCDTQPNRPRNSLVLPDVEAPKLVDQWDAAERNQLLYDGISTLKADVSGRVMIERLITTYQTNSSGTADATYLSIETIRNLAHTMLEFLGLGARHERDLVGPDGGSVSPGVPIATPATVRGEVIALYRSRERRGLAKDVEGFASDLLVELDEVDPERINVHASPRLVNGLVTLAMKLSFQL